jgi:hypothetical protein
MEHDRKRGFVTDTSWVGVLLVTVGACGFLDAAGIVDSSQTIGSWWPLVIVAWAAIDMARIGAVTQRGIVWSAIGVALLADVQLWASDIVIWSALAVFVGTVMVVGAFVSRSDGRRSAASVTAGRS